MESFKAVFDTKVNITNAYVDFHLLESLAAADRLAIRSSIEGRESVKGKLRKTWASLQAAKGALTAIFDHVKLHSSGLRTAKVAGKTRSKSNLQIYI